MSSDALHDRGRALEEAFFAKKNRELLEQLRKKQQTEERRAEIQSTTGIRDVEVLDHLIAQGVDAQSVTALMLVPLVRVAWADRTVEAKEREAILAAAKDSGIDEGHANYTLLQNWLEQRPGDELFATWSAYVGALKNTLDTSAFRAIGAEVTSRAQAVAKAAGGILGVGKISSSEQKVLDEISKAFA